MKFISGGDFVFPFSFKTYFHEQIYLWSYNGGVPNLDEIIRFFLRIPNVLVYGLTGSNVAVSYFYIATIAVACFLSFRYFCLNFIDIKDPKTIAILSLLYTFNPIFLGNYAKIGLILAATMLPLLLTFIKKFYATEKIRYLLLVILALNISFLHPFTLAVNFAAAATYFVILGMRERDTLLRSIPRLVVVVGVALLINAYIILSVVSLGSVQKGLLSQNLSDTSLSSANLTTIANTGDILTAFSMSKNVFLDFQFYHGAYKYLYFLGIYMLLALVIGLFMSGYYHMVKRYKKFLLVAMLCFLLLMLCTTGTFMGVGAFMALLAKLPGGWAFRSPLKWQLYMPLFFCAITALLLEVQQKEYKRYAFMAIGVIFVLINGYLGYDVGRKLIKPDSSRVALQTQHLAPTASRALLVKDAQCYEYFNTDFTLLNNIREAYAADAVQLKEIDAPDVKGINLNNYAQIVSCSKPKELDMYAFKASGNMSTDGKSLLVFNNEHAKPKVYISNLFAIPKDSLNLATKQGILKDEEKLHADFVDQEDNIASSKSMTELFETIGSENIEEHALTAVLNLQNFKNNPTIVSKEKAYYTIDGDTLSLSAQPEKGSQETAEQQPLPASLLSQDVLKIRYTDKNYRLNNLVKNGSLDDGLWQDKVGDCFNYDSSPSIGMSLNTQDKTDGKQSLELRAERHVACTGPDEFPIIGDESYLVYFDYKTSKDMPAKYNIFMNGYTQSAVEERLPNTKGEWKHFSAIVQAPFGMNAMKITLYGIPSVEKGETTTLYDNVRVIKVPKVGGGFFVGTGIDQTPNTTATVTSTTLNPTKVAIRMEKAQGQITLALNDTYSKGWKLHAPDHSLLPFGIRYAPAQHIKINRQENAWILDVDKYCSQSSRCISNEDGTHTVDMVIEFMPQRWLWVGLAISSITLISLLTYIGFSYKRDRKQR
jgi:hypothetical protein